METDFISLASLEKAKKKLKLLISLMVSIAVLFAAYCVMAGLLQNRSTQYLWIGLGTAVTTIFLLVEAYILLMVVGPLRSYMKFAKKALSRKRFLNKIRVIGTKKKSETYLGIETYTLTVEELDEKTVWDVRYPIREGFDPEIGEEYLIESFDEVILRAEKL